MKLSDKETDLLFKVFECYQERVDEDQQVLGRYFEQIKTRDKLAINANNLLNKITKELT